MKYYCEKYKSLTFYVDGIRHQFLDGFYETTNKKEQTVLNELPDVKKLEKGEDELATS
ncbi:hypothetical protein [Brevibacillus formosus]|uniref:hypothetical protein n=1 Tax=Brevibacillus formosus TaxID=54913 RepID=UPI003F1E2A36